MSAHVKDQIRVGLLELDESYALGKKVDIFHKKSNTLQTLTVCNIMLVRFVRNTHWTTEWLVHLT
ncbi:hypothetical protein CON22_17945 [Bacillus cereus]|nr:hypothetical protein CON22_17945 [Bacillus cereus]